MGCGKLLLRFDKMKLSKKDSFCLRLHLKSFTYYRQKAEKSKGSPFSGKERLEGLNQNVSIWVFHCSSVGLMQGRTSAFIYFCCNTGWTRRLAGLDIFSHKIGCLSESV